MTSDKLENLVRIGQLKKELPRADELAGLKRSGLSRLADAERDDLSFESRFDLAYNAAHALALYALRRMGYRAESRYLVFQVLPQAVGLAAGYWRVLPRRTKNAILLSMRDIWSRMSACCSICSPQRGFGRCPG